MRNTTATSSSACWTWRKRSSSRRLCKPSSPGPRRRQRRGGGPGAGDVRGGRLRGEVARPRTPPTGGRRAHRLTARGPSGSGRGRSCKVFRPFSDSLLGAAFTFGGRRKPGRPSCSRRRATIRMTRRCVRSPRPAHGGGAGPSLRHLGGCPACCRRIDQLATDDRLLARLQQRATSREQVLATPAQRRSAVRALRQSPDAEPAAGEPGRNPRR